MPYAANLEIQAALPGLTKTVKFARTAASCLPGVDASLEAANAGTLSARGGDTSGTLTLAADHDIETGDTIAIFWSGGRCYMATAGEVDGTSVPFSGAYGDVLPAEDTAVVADAMQNYDCDFDGDLLEMLVVRFSARGLVLFEDAVGASAAAVQHVADVAAGEGLVYVAGTDMTNEFEGNAVDEIWIANGDSSQVNEFSFGGLYNSDT